MTIFIGLLIVYLVGVGWALWAFSAMRGRVYWYNVKSALLWPRFIFFNLTSLGKIVSLVIVALFIALLIFLSGCAPKFGPRPVEMKTGLGQPVTMTEPQRTGDRDNVPAGVKPEDVVAHIITKSGGETYVDKKGNVYQNKQAQEENAKPPDIPKRPWYYWPLRVLIVIAVLVAVYMILFLRTAFAPLCGFIKRLLKIA